MRRNLLSLCILLVFTSTLGVLSAQNWKYFPWYSGSSLLSPGQDGLWLSNFGNAFELRRKRSVWQKKQIDNFSSGVSVRGMGNGVQDPDGTWWIAGNRGIWKVKNDNYELIQPGSRGANPIQFVARDSSGVKWFSNNQDLISFDGNQWKVTALDSFFFSFFKDLVDGPDGNPWLSTYDGVYIFDGQHLTQAPTVLMKNFTKMRNHPDGSLAMIDSQNLYKYQNGVLYTHPITDFLNNSPSCSYSFRDFIVLENGDLWIAVREGGCVPNLAKGILVVHPDMSFEEISQTDQGHDLTAVFQLEMANNGRLFLEIANYGIATFFEGKWEIIPLYDSPLGRSSHGQIANAKGHVYVGRNEISVYHTMHNTWSLIDIPDEYFLQDLFNTAEEEVYASFFDFSGGSIDNFSKIFRMQPDGLTPVQNLPPNYGGLTYPSPEGGFWLTLSGEDPTLFKTEYYLDGQIKESLSFQAPSPVSGISRFIRDKEGTFWLIQNTEIFRCRDGNCEAIPAPFPNTGIISICLDHEGNVWTNGINLAAKWTEETWQTYFSPFLIKRLFSDPQGRLWAGTFADGLLLFNGFTFQQVEINGTASYPSSEISFDDIGNLYISSDGLLIFNPEGIRLGETIFTQAGILDVFPNPTSDNAHVKIPLKENVTLDLKLISLEGKVLSQESVLGAKGYYGANFDLRKLPSGLYLWQVSGNGINYSGKVIKE